MRTAQKTRSRLVVKSYFDASYFRRNLRALAVLIDQEKVRAGVGSTASALLEGKNNLLRMRQEHSD